MSNSELNSNILELAKQGNSRAIAALINRQLQSKKIICKASRKDGILQILLEASDTPNQKVFSSFLEKGIKKINPQGVKIVKIYGKSKAKDNPDWNYSFELPLKEELFDRKSVDVDSEKPESKRVKVSVGSRNSNGFKVESIANPKTIVSIGIGALLVIIAPLTLLAFRQLGVCKVEGEPAHEVLDSLNKRWNDARTLASSTSRMSLPSQIKELQSIKQEAESIKWSSCSEPAADMFIKSMGATIEGFISFLDPDKPESIIKDKFKSSQAYSDNFYKEYITLLPHNLRIQEEKEQAQINSRVILGLVISQQLLAYSHNKDFIQKLDDSELDISTLIDNNNKYYKIEILEASDSKTVITSKARKKDLKSFGLGVSSISGNFKNVICETEESSRDINPPKLVSDSWDCAPGSVEASPL